MKRISKYICSQQKPIFQMKSRKPRQNQPRKVMVPLEEQSTFQSQLKHPSSHTKISTTGTIHSSLPHQSLDKRPKNKKNPKSMSKEPTAEPSPTTSKSRRKPALAIPLREESLNYSQPLESCREYCLVEDSFFPITDLKQQKLLEEMFAQTASTTFEINPFDDLENSRIVREKPKRLKKKSITSVKSNLSRNQEKEVICWHEIGVQTTKREKEMACMSVEAVTENCQIGIQYSQRKALVEQIVEEPKSEVQVQVEAQIQQHQNQSLSDLLFKLEFTHLGDEKSFSLMSTHEKEHFAQLLQTVLGKLTPQSHKPQLKPISFQELDDSPTKGHDDCMHASSDHFPQRKPGNVQLELLNEKLEQLVCLREYRQLNLIQDNCQYDNESKVNTTLMSILNFLGHIFCYIEVHYSQEFVYMIRKMYGHSFKEKYKRITRSISMAQQKKFRIIDETLFQDFVNENVKDLSTQDNENCNYNEILHLKAVFDAFNEHLEEYRPYYLGNGEQFPWAFKMFITMSEYSIDQESLQIIFRQAKDKIVEWATLLCGIMVEYDQKELHPKNPVDLKRLQRQNKLITNWIAEENFQKDEVQLFGTQSLHETAEMIYSELMEEFVRQAGFFFN